MGKRRRTSDEDSGELTPRKTGMEVVNGEGDAAEDQHSPVMDASGNVSITPSMKDKIKKKKKRKHQDVIAEEVDESAKKKKAKKKKKKLNGSDGGSPTSRAEQADSKEEQDLDGRNVRKKRGKSSHDMDSEQNGLKTNMNDANGSAALPEGGTDETLSIEAILSKSEKKRDVFLNGPAAIQLLSPTDVRQLDEQKQYSFLKSATGFCDRLLRLLHDTVTTGNAWKKSPATEELTTVEESLTNDMIRLKNVSVAKQFVEMTLWRRIVQFNGEQLDHASRLGYGKGVPVLDAHEANGGLLLHSDGDPDAKFVSFKEAHMKTMVERFGEELEKMREGEGMDAEKVQFLLRCLESGASLFSNLKCLDSKRGGGIE